MPPDKRTIRDRDYSELLRRHGPLTNSDLCKKVTEHPHFSKMTTSAIEKDIDRFVVRFEYLKLVARNNGRIEWLPQPAKAQEQVKQEETSESSECPTSYSQHEEVQRLLKGMANGTITLRNKSPHKELNRLKGEIYDKFMADISLYNSNELGYPFSGVLETRIFNTYLKLRAYGFIEETKKPPHSAQNSQAENQE
ncbi:MAG TPA: hypothetical protein VKF15_08390 [Nitrososphaerales archaeon]|nr:hypothetical protein [Nitrososphaerales archaeon]